MLVLYELRLYEDELEAEGMAKSVCYWFVSCWNHLFTRRVEGTRPLVNKIDPGYHHWHDTMAQVICVKK